MPEYAGGASEPIDEPAKGFATVGGFPGRRVGGELKFPSTGLCESVGEEDFDILDEERLNRELWLDLRRKRLKADGIDLGELVLPDESEQKDEVVVAASRMKGMLILAFRLAGNE